MDEFDIPLSRIPG